MPSPIPLTDQIAWVTREIAVRQRVYPRLERFTMTQAQLDDDLACLQAVLATLERLARPGQAELFAPTAPEEPSHA